LFSFSTNSKNIFYENCFMEGKTSPKHKCKNKCFIHRLYTNCMGIWFLTINKPISSKIDFCCIWYFGKGFLVTKTLTIALLVRFDLFLQFVFPILLSMDCSLHFKHFCNNIIVYFHMFFQWFYSICCIIWD